MLIENTGLNGLRSDLAHLDEMMEQLGFVRWQWEYYRATYDLKMETSQGDYYLRINCRTVEGKLESPHAILQIESIYVGKATFPHGVDYQSPLPEQVHRITTQKLNELKRRLTA